MTNNGENVERRFGPVRWWGFTHEHSPHRHAELRIGRVRLHAEAWVNRYPVSTSRVCLRLGGFYDRKRGHGYAASGRRPSDGE
jgi:hypothetical protein